MGYQAKLTPATASAPHEHGHDGPGQHQDGDLGRVQPGSAAHPGHRALANPDRGGEVEDDEPDQDGDVRARRAPVGVLSAHGEPDRAEGGQDRDRPGRQEPRRGGRKLAAGLLGGLVQQGGGLPWVEVAAVAGGGGAVRCGVHSVSLHRLYVIK